MMDPVIVTRELSRAFGDIHAVEKVSLEVGKGEMFGLVGPDGSGKTTTIRLLCGILTPTSGTATVLGYDIVKNPEAVKREIGYLSQRFSLYGDLSIDENIEFFAEINGVFDFKARRDELLAFTRLTPFRTRLAEQLSGGMKQKLALACTLIHKPKLLFLDEPTTGVDPVSRRDFWKILQSLLTEGITIVMNTPYLDEAERCTRVAFMNQGTILRVDTPDGLRGDMREQVVEVVIDRVRHGFSLLRSQPGLKEVQAFGDRVNVMVADPESSLPRLRALLAGNGIEVKSMRTIVPSLENVFISLLTHSHDGVTA
ncbi:MAG TPA: ABC transporter ATP-binding protein [Bacteroidota bacterium]|nr:ABC transporter ATP-binding protein [Bacteroidota bacterium]